MGWDKFEIPGAYQAGWIIEIDMVICSYNVQEFKCFFDGQFISVDTNHQVITITQTDKKDWRFSSKSQEPGEER